MKIKTLYSSENIDNTNISILQVFLFFVLLGGVTRMGKQDREVISQDRHRKPDVSDLRSPVCIFMSVN